MKPLVYLGRVPIFDTDGSVLPEADTEIWHPFGRGTVPEIAAIARFQLEEMLLRSSRRFPGTVRAAEWVACYTAVQMVRGLERDKPPLNWKMTIGGKRYDDDPLPLLLHTTNPDIADFLEGRAPFAQSPWLKRIQEAIARIAEGKIVKRRGHARSFFAPTDRPWAVSDQSARRLARFEHGLPVYARVIPRAENLRALRAAESGLRETRAFVYADW